MAEEASREETMEFLFDNEPTAPSILEWKPLAVLFKSTIRLRMNITKQNASLPLVDACRTFSYPSEAPPEVQGLLRVLDNACLKANVKYQLTKGARKLQEGLVGFFEPYIIQLPFKKARLSMTIAPGEFQWILKNIKKEKPPFANQLERLKHELLKETREWLRKGNR